MYINLSIKCFRIYFLSILTGNVLIILLLTISWRNRYVEIAYSAILNQLARILSSIIHDDFGLMLSYPRQFSSLKFQRCKNSLPMSLRLYRLCQVVLESCNCLLLSILCLMNIVCIAQIAKTKLLYALGSVVSA